MSSRHLSSIAARPAAEPRLAAPRRARLGIALSCLLAPLGALVFAEEARLAVPSALSEAAASIEAHAALARVRFLASDELEGRDTLSLGLQVSARYLAAEMEALGIEPAGDDGTYLHRVDLREIGMVAGSGITRLDTGAFFPIDGAAVSYLPGTAEGAVEGELVFAGYAITSDAPPYDDFEGVDLTGKIALVLRYEPGEKDPDSFFDGERNTRHAYVQTKIDRCRAAGAAAILLVTGPRYHAGKDAFLGGLPRIAGLAGVAPRAPRQGQRQGQRAPAAPLPGAHVSQRAADQLLAGTGLDLAATQIAIDADLVPRSRALGVRVRLSLKTEERVVSCHNVAGILRGSDPAWAHEAVVIGAHYDHVGVGGTGPDDFIHNGADDNASGTVAVLEAARGLVRSAIRPRRSVLFLFFTAEELGLFGSRAWVARPSVPLDDIVGMLNLDMVGRNATDELTIHGTSDAPGLWRLIDAANQSLSPRFNLRAVPRSGGGSDHQNFNNAGIPAVHFFSGFHPEYHQPGDHTELIDGEKVARSGRLAMVAAWLAADPDAMPSRRKASPTPTPSPTTPPDFF